MPRVITFLLFVLAASLALADEIGRDATDNLVPRGIVRAGDQATLGIEFAAPVRKINYREGESFEKGAAIVVFDCRKQKAEFDAAAAVHREAELVLANHDYLRKRGATGQHDVEVARIRVAKAAAEAEALRLRLEQCTIHAPFDGSVVELKIYEHEFPTPGTPFLKIIGAQSLEIELIVPSQWLVWLKPGQPFRFRAEETAKSYAAHVRRIATAVDPVSQTVKIFGKLDAPGDVLAGMSGTAEFPRRSKERE